MIYARLQNMKIQIFVMPARIAGIEVCRDASGDIHVGLDSSTPCWNDGIGSRPKTDRRPPPLVFSTKSSKVKECRKFVAKTM